MKDFYRLELITAPTVEPWDSASASDMTAIKNYLKMHSNITADDTLIEEMIVETREKVEAFTNRALINQTWEMIFNTQPRIIDIPLGQLSSVTSIKTIADDESETTEDTDIYTTETGDYGHVFLRTGNIWTATDRRYSKFKVRFVAGYGAAKTDVPTKIRLAIKQLINKSYYTREIPIEETAAAFTLSDYILYAL